MSAVVAAAGNIDAMPPESYDPSRILVRLRNDAAGVDGAKVLPGSAVGRAVGLDRNLHEVNLGRGVSVKAALAAYRNNPNVEYAEPNWVYTAQAESNDPFYTNGSLWGMYGDATSPTNQYGSQAGEAWAKAVDANTKNHTGSKSVYVGVIDEGIDWNHPDLIDNVWNNPYDPADGTDNDKNGYVDDVRGWDFAGNNSSVYDGADDDHGTHVAGTIAAKGGNGIGVAGVNWDVTYIPGKFLGATGGSTLDAIEAVDYFTDLKTRHGLNIVATNNSWGGGGFSQGLLDAITRAAKVDILFVAAAGNGGSDQIGDNNDSLASYPSNYDTTAGAGYDAVVAVGAINSDGGLATLSNYGAKTVDLGAPGVSVLSTLPGNTYGYASGTSMATPHVTGAAALYAAVHPNSSALTIKNAILDAARVTAAQTASLAGKTATGGRLDVDLVLRQSQVAASPTNLAAAATSSSQIALTWTDNSGNEDGFYIERSADGINNWVQVGKVGANATGYANTNLTAETPYHYRVSAYRGLNVSAVSNVAKATTNAAVAVPIAPSGLTATGATTGGISLAWQDNAGDESGFAVERRLDGTTWAQVRDLGANVTAYSDTGLTAATTYYYRVRAYRTEAGGKTAYSDYTGTFAASTAAAVGTGTGLRGDYYDNMLTEDNREGYKHLYSLSGWKFARTDATVNANWGTGAPSVSTKLRLSADTFVVKWTGAIQPRYTDDYTFQFKPDDGVGIWITVDGVKQSLWTPTWDRFDNDNRNGTGTEYANTSPHQSAPLALKAGVKYPIEVVYYEYTGGASAQLLWKANTYQPQYEVIPQAQLYQGPTELTATGVASGKIDLRWTDNAADEDGFKVERSADAGKTWTPIATLGANATTFSDSGLTASATYTYRVRAYNGTPAFNSAYSNAASAKASGPSTFSSSLITTTWRDELTDLLA